MWEADDLEALEVRKAGWRSEREGRERRQPTDRSDRSDHPDQAVDAKIYDRWFKHDDPAIVANALLCLIHQANYLLDQQIAALEQEFIEEGGYS